MKQPFDISQLVDELQPVRPMNMRRGLMLPLGMTMAALAVIATFAGVRADLMAGAPHPMFLLRAGTLLLLGLVCATTLLAMANPGVGRHGHGWKTALAAALLFPLAATILALAGQPSGTSGTMQSGVQCLAYSLIAGLGAAVPMVLWLRKGAPVAIEKAGWLTGLAAGGLGAFAYNFHCPFNSIVYTGFWYSLAVGLCALLGRVIVPRLIRW
ncbi:NrsF family protein [Sphingorhabdus sp.]|uniref:NrsF family protein n=1 Tax=Sphingorhabdus sp. TaxID=1902408 RepID=UPI0035ADD870